MILTDVKDRCHGYKLSPKKREKINVLLSVLTTGEVCVQFSTVGLARDILQVSTQRICFAPEAALHGHAWRVGDQTKQQTENIS